MVGVLRDGVLVRCLEGGVVGGVIGGVSVTGAIGSADGRSGCCGEDDSSEVHVRLLRGNLICAAAAPNDFAVSWMMASRFMID